MIRVGLCCSAFEVMLGLEFLFVRKTGVKVMELEFSWDRPRVGGKIVIRGVEPGICLVGSGVVLGVQIW